MGRSVMNTILRSLEVLRYQLGLIGLVGLFSVLASLLLGLTLLMPAQHTLQQKMSEMTLLSTQPKSNSAPQTPVLNDAQALSKFYKQFPPISDLSKVLEQLHQLASDKGVSLSNGEYKLSNDANNPSLMRYEIIFPVQASYKNLRDFITAASQQFPTLGLAEVNLKRESVKDTAVQIKLSYVLLLVRSR
jgi:Tfp pilus assembly protein PilO